jgi:TPR repeat protein
MAFKEAVEHVFFQIISAFNPEIDALAQTLRKLAFRDQEKDVLMLLSNHAHLISSIEAAAKRDHLESQWLLGMCHNYGIGIEQSVEEALTWLEIAGQAGHVASQYYFALLQERSQIVVNEDQKLTIAQWYAYAAQGGYAPAQYKLGISKWADAATQDHKEAFQWFKKSADQNYIPAYSTLATCYERGWGIAIDVEEAVRLYRIAVNESHAPSMHHLGRILTKGAQGIQRDKTNGEKYIQHAAELGFEEVEAKIRSDATVIMSH